MFLESQNPQVRKRLAGNFHRKTPMSHHNSLPIFSMVRTFQEYASRPVKHLSSAFSSPFISTDKDTLYRIQLSFQASPITPVSPSEGAGKRCDARGQIHHIYRGAPGQTTGYRSSFDSKVKLAPMKKLPGNVPVPVISAYQDLMQVKGGRPVDDAQSMDMGCTWL